jgi:hypothetical protein
MRTEVVERDIVVIRDAFSWGPELIAVANRLDRWKQSNVLHGARVVVPAKTERVSRELLIRGVDDPALVRFEKRAYKLAGDAAREYFARSAAFGTRGDNGYVLRRYDKGGHYAPHIDLTIHDGKLRLVALCVYPNDDYKGGELDFPRQKFRFKPEAGSVVLFPANFTHIHASLPVKSGTKYTLCSWFF